MDWSVSSEEAAFRAKIREFFDEKLPQRYRESYSSSEIHMIRASNGREIPMTGRGWSEDRMSEDAEIAGAAEEWAAALTAEGYVASSWAKELGGAGFTVMEQFLFNEERERASAPRVGGTGAMFLGQLLMVYGTEEQRAKWMPPIDPPSISGESNATAANLNKTTSTKWESSWVGHSSTGPTPNENASH